MISCLTELPLYRLLIYIYGHILWCTHFLFIIGFWECSGSVVFFCFSLLDFVNVPEAWYFLFFIIGFCDCSGSVVFFVFHYWILRVFRKHGIFCFSLLDFVTVPEAWYFLFYIIGFCDFRKHGIFLFFIIGFWDCSGSMVFFVFHYWILRLF